MKLSKVCKALSSITRLRILKILVDRRLSAADIHKEYNKYFEDRLHRESIYRALEKMVDAEILTKEYDGKRKQLVYFIRHKNLKIDLIEQTVLAENYEK